MTCFIPSMARFLLLGLVLLAQGGCLSSSHPGTGASLSADATLAQIRQSKGLSRLEADGKLEAAAARQAGYMASAGRMAHTTGFGRDFASRMRKDDIEGAAAENVAHGRMDVARLLDMWMNSAGHRRNMLDPRFSKYGLAAAEDKSGQRYWALVLGR